jgi:hypothetical protein
VSARRRWRINRSPAHPRCRTRAGRERHLLAREPADEHSLIDTANSYFYSLQYDEAQFAFAEAGYGTASTKFGDHADAFSAAVLQLQRQLKSAVGQ